MDGALKTDARTIDYLRMLFADLGIRNSAILNWLNDHTKGHVSSLHSLTPEQGIEAHRGIERSEAEKRSASVRVRGSHGAPSWFRRARAMKRR